MKLSSSECHKILSIRSQHWFRYWLGAIRHQAITWANVDPDLCHHMVVLGHNWVKCSINCKLIYSFLQWCVHLVSRVAYTDFLGQKQSYCQISNIRCTKSPNLNVSHLVLLYRFCPIHWNQVLSREWRCSWSSTDRRCANYIFVINKFIAH